MTDKPAAAAETVAIQATRSGVALDAATTRRIAAAISPALANFDCPALMLGMAEEPSGWTRRAAESVAKGKRP